MVQRRDDLDENVNSIVNKLFSMAGEVNNRIAEENGKVHGAEDEDDDADDASISSGGKAASSATDSVEISAFGRKVAANAPKPVRVMPKAQPAQTGAVFNAIA
jgi:hypothetical protein